MNKVIKDYSTLKDLINVLKKLDNRIVITIGSWDLLHIGHVRYLIEAKKKGDVLIVGVDTDRAIKLYKGPFRPVVPEGERAEMLSYQACVDYVAFVDDVKDTGEWEFELINLAKPDVFVAVEDSYPEEQLKEIRKYCKEVVVLPRQAEGTSTSRMIQNTVKKQLDRLYEIMETERG
jgi:D-beta-D-heptose 7-phosphate kinase/D-beta-D-heptose 1-phosphate adenosyltransferase